jgi:hypothetical protein
MKYKILINIGNGKAIKKIIIAKNQKEVLAQLGSDFMLFEDLKNEYSINITSNKIIENEKE